MIMNHSRGTIPLVLTLLAGLAAKADTSFTSTGWLSAVPLPGIMTTNGSGQVSLRGNVHVVRNQATDARVTGRLQAWMDLGYQSDGTAIFSGPAYSEVGSWDGTNFTPSGGVWALNYSGVAQADGSSQYSMAGYGIGGNIEGLRISLTATRAAPGDPSTPYLASGTIKPAPVQTSVVVDNFDNNHFDTSIWTATGAGSGTLSLNETDQHLTIGGTWRSPTDNVVDHTAWVWTDRGWSVPDGQTVELRADLVGLNGTGAAAFLALYHDAQNQGYGLTKAGDYILLWKARSNTMVFFSGTRVITGNTNVVLVFAITPVGPNVVLTGKVLDRNGTVLGQQSYVDTPAADSALSQAEAAQLTGGRLYHDVGPDAAGTPWRSGTSVFLGVFQDTDGTQPAAQATVDNVELRTYEVPPVAIERAVRLSWPATGQNYAIEAAPTAQGPWQPLANSEMPATQGVSVPAGDFRKFFRLQQAP
jgi:hypothetical protein